MTGGSLVVGEQDPRLARLDVQGTQGLRLTSFADAFGDFGHKEAELSGAIADRRDTRACPVVPASGTIPTPKLTPPAELLWEYQQCVPSGLHPIQQRVTSGMHPIAQNF
jgi:hypothetical protein